MKLKMKCCVVLCLLVGLASSLPTNFYKAEWDKFKATYGKLYSSADEENLRFHIFSKNLDEITEHNRLYEQGLSSYKMGLNKFSDYTAEEYQRMLGVLPKSARVQLNQVDNEEMFKKEWQAFKKEYGRIYLTQDEEQFRYQIFKNNLQQVMKHNDDYDKGITTFKMGINNFADMTAEEIEKHMGLIHPKSIQAVKVPEHCSLEWDKFKKSFGKSYSASEENVRFGTFCKNLNTIEKHNGDYEKGLTTFKMGINQFADMTEEEMKNYMGVLPNNMVSFISVDDSCENQYKDFKKSYGKVYDTEEDEAEHLNIFCNNLKKIEQHNEMFKNGKTTFEMGVNQFTDMTEEEIKRYLGFIDGHEYGGSFITPQSESTCKNQYEDYKKSFGKVYEPQDEHLHRDIFCKNLIAIKEHNKDYENGKTSYKMGVNIFTDMTVKEIKQHMGLIDEHSNEYVVSAYLPEDVYQDEWKKFKVTFKKIYPNQEEENHRFQVFCDNLDKIYKHNELYKKGQTTFKMGVNQYTDMTHEEYIEYLNEGRL